MADGGHKGAFPTQADLAAFLRSLGTHDAVARAADVAHGTYIKWHQTDGTKMSAVNLLRVVIALGAEDRFARWLRTFAPNVPKLPVPLDPVSLAQPVGAVLVPRHDLVATPPKKRKRSRRSGT